VRITGQAKRKSLKPARTCHRAPTGLCHGRESLERHSCFRRLISVKKAKKQLLKIEAELVEGKRLLKEKNKKVKTANRRLAKENAKQARKTVKAAVESLQEHRDLLEEKAAS
jgi:hypothetical protein